MPSRLCRAPSALFFNPGPVCNQHRGFSIWRPTLNTTSTSQFANNSPINAYTRPPLVTQALALLAGEIRQSFYLSSPIAVRDYLQLLLADKPHEVFVVVFLDAQHQVLDVLEMFRGSLTQTSVYPREIVVESLARNAAAVILAHNHPSGAADASTADRALTSTLQTVLALVDVRVLDHFIVTRTRALSFAEQGWL